MEVDIKNKKFNRLTAIEKTKSVKRKNSSSTISYWLFKCNCGKVKEIRKECVVRGTTKSCGCYNIEKTKEIDNTTHGKSDTRLYEILHGMKDRCINNKLYTRKNIEVCIEWLNDFMSFYNWAMSNGYRDNLSIDRIDNSKGYYPENCRWATRNQQQRNTDLNRILEYNGENLCIVEWSEITGLRQDTIWRRLNRGWSVEKTLTTPLMKNQYSFK
jgi:hypothetical protein